MITGTKAETAGYGRHQPIHREGVPVVMSSYRAVILSARFTPAGLSQLQYVSAGISSAFHLPLY